MKDYFSRMGELTGAYIGRMGVGQPLTVIYIDDVDGAIHSKIDKEIQKILGGRLIEYLKWRNPNVTYIQVKTMTGGVKVSVLEDTVTILEV